MASNALTWITKKAKQLKKQNPTARRTWGAYIKQASNLYARQKNTAPVKRKKKKVSRKVRAKVSSIVIREKKDKPRSKPKRVYVVERSKKGTFKNYRRVGAAGSSNLLPIALGLVGIGLLFFAFKKPTTPIYPNNYPTNYPAYNPTGSMTRDSQAQKIIAWATAGGLAIDAIAKLIQSLNTSNDSTINQLSDNIDTGNGIPDYYFV